MPEPKGTKGKQGTLEVVCGPMFSGKSEELIRRLRRAQIAKLNVLTCKHALDNRHTIECVVTHNGNKLKAEALSSVEDILRLGQEKNIDVVGIDEVQWFDNYIISIICKLIEAGKRVIVAGLDLDFRGVPFGSMPILLAVADHITKLQAICTICGKDAHFTQRLVNNKPANYDDPVILVGAQESYQARCRDCHAIDKQPTFSKSCQYY
ncbi:thymidine kinase [bacterium]|nr:thymidine kinase [bacterium]